MVAATLRLVGGMAEGTGRIVGQGFYYLAALLEPTANPRRVRIPRQGLLLTGDDLLVTPDPDGLRVKPLKTVSGKKPEGLVVPDDGAIH